MDKQENNEKKERKYQSTPKGINTINFYSFNFEFMKHQQVLLYCCLLQESEKYHYGWFFWKDKAKMQYSRSTYENLRDKLIKKGLIHVINGSYNNKQHFLIDYQFALDNLGKLFKDRHEEMKVYLEAAKEKQKVMIQSQEKLNTKSGLTEIQIKEEAEQIEDSITVEETNKVAEQIRMDDSIQKEETKQQQQQEIAPIQFKEENPYSIEEGIKQEEQSTSIAIELPIQSKKEKTFLDRCIACYPCLQVKTSLPDKYLMTENQKATLKKTLNVLSIADADINTLLERIKEYKVGKAAGGKIVEDVIARAKEKKNEPVQSHIATVQNLQATTITTFQFQKEVTDQEIREDLSFMDLDFTNGLIQAVPSIKQKRDKYRYYEDENLMEKIYIVPKRLSALGYTEEQVRQFGGFMDNYHLDGSAVLEIFYYIVDFAKQKEQVA